jgi:hypothetical protein
MFIQQKQSDPDVIIWDNRNGTWKIIGNSKKGSQVFNEEFKMNEFQIGDSDLLRVILLCASNGLLISSSLE